MNKNDSNKPALTREHALELLQGMIRIRRFEEKCAELYSAMKIRGFLHLYIGEEAIAVGVMQALQPEDAIGSTCREHGHALARGISMNAIMAELYGKQEGCSHGRGGSMHIFDAATRFYGGSAIVAGGLPVAIGLALADKMQRLKCVGEETAVQQEPKVPEGKAPPEKPELAPIPRPAKPTRRHGPRASPAARRRAAALHTDLEAIVGTGPDGAITVQDVEQVSAETEPAAMRRAIAAAMSRSKREIPHYYLGTTIDLSHTLAWLEQQNTERPITERMVYAVPLIKAVALALGKVPDLNGFWVKDHFETSESVHVGVAISLRQGGLVVSALHDVQSKNLDTLMQEFHDLVNRTRTGHIRLSEFTKPTITFTSLGEQGVETTYPIVYPPQVAIVGFGSIIERPWSIEGQIESRRVIKATLAADHRVSDGRSGAVFLNTVNRLLQKPEAL